MRLRFVSVSLAALVLAQCGDLSEESRSVDETEEQPVDDTPEYRYRFRHLMNGIPCDTGEHVFEDKLSYCQALVDHRLNRECALDARKDEFAEQCQDVAAEWPPSRQP